MPNRGGLITWPADQTAGQTASIAARGHKPGQAVCLRRRGEHDRASGRVGAAVDLAEERAWGDFGRRQPRLQGRARTGLFGPPAWNGDFGAFAVGVRFGSFDQKLQALVGPGRMGDIETHQLGAPHGAGEADQEQGAIPGAGAVDPARPAQSLKMFRRAGGFRESTGIGLARIGMGNLMVLSEWRRKMVRR